MILAPLDTSAVYALRMMQSCVYITLYRIERARWDVCVRPAANDA